MLKNLLPCNMQNYIKIFNKQNLKLILLFKLVKIVNSCLIILILLYLYYANFVLNILKLFLKIYFIFLSVTFLWTLSLYIIPILKLYGGLWSEFADYGYMFFSSTCHQSADRSYFLFGYKLAVCSRCTSIYSGFLLSVILYPFIMKIENKKLPPLWILLVFTLFVILDVLFDITGIIKNTFISRSISGAMIGFILPFYLIPGTINFTYEIYMKYFNNENE